MFTHDAFHERLNDVFRVSIGDQSLDLALIECTRLTPHSRNGEPRDPFTLTFRGQPTPVLPQSVYSLQNEHMGKIDIFLVPIGPDGVGMRYEAVFN
jgi:hypothetical protein